MAMTRICMTFLLMTVFFTVSTSCCLLFRRAVKGRGMKTVWAAVLILSVIPLRILSPRFSVTVRDNDVEAVTVSFTRNVGYLPDTVTHDTTASETDGDDTPSLTVRSDLTAVLKWLPTGLLTVWAVGCCVTVARLLYSYRKLRTRLRTHTSAATDDNVTTAFSGLCRKYGVNGVTLCRLDDSVMISPCAVGILHPHIYYCRNLTDMDEEALSSVLLHETLHIRRGDLVCRLTAALILSVYWFCPQRGRIYAAVCDDLEYACDNAVLKRIGNDGKAAYMRALLTVAESVSQCLKQPSILCTAFSGIPKNSLKRRFLYMKNSNQKRNRIAALMGGIFMAAVLVMNMVLTSACGYSEDNDNVPFASVSLNRLDPLSIALCNRFGLVDIADITDEQLASITSIEVCYEEDSSGYTLTKFCFNGEEAENLLPSVVEKDVFRYMIYCQLKNDGCTAEELSDYLYDEAELFEDGSAYQIICANHISDPTPVNNSRKLLSYYAYKSVNLPGLEPRAKEEMLLMYPFVEAYDCYILDPYITDREASLLYRLGVEAGIFPKEAVSEDVIRAAIGKYPSLATAALTFRK